MSKTTTTPSDDSVSVGAKPKRINSKKPVIIHATRTEAETGPVNTHWRTHFLDALIATSNITHACKVAGVAPSRAYLTRRMDRDFYRKWCTALAEGYLNLEMELLCYLRDPEATGKMDVAGAIRLLTLHRQTVAHERAMEDDRDEQAVLDSIDAMIDEMRVRSAANTALLSAAAGNDGQHEA